MNPVVISEPDITTAVDHLQRLPNTRAYSMPRSWARSHVLKLVREAVGASPKINELLPIGNGLWLLIKPVGIDLAGFYGPDARRQVLVLIRPNGTDLERMVDLATVLPVMEVSNK